MTITLDDLKIMMDMLKDVKEPIKKIIVSPLMWDALLRQSEVQLRGYAICGRPVGREVPYFSTLELNKLTFGVVIQLIPYLPNEVWGECYEGRTILHTSKGDIEVSIEIGG